MSELVAELRDAAEKYENFDGVRLSGAIRLLTQAADRIAELEARDSKNGIDKACATLIELGFSTGHGDTWEDIAWECIGNLEVCRAALQEEEGIS